MHKAPEIMHLGGLLFTEFRVLAVRGSRVLNLDLYSLAPLLVITSRYQWKDFLR